MKMTVRFALGLVLSGVGALQAVSAAPPATQLITAPLVPQGAAWTYYDTLPNPNARSPASAWAQSQPEITALARSLGAERYTAGQITADQFIQNVFDYVRHNIDTEFRFGLGKGGRGALIDQSGTSFDQAELMVRLLRASTLAVPDVTIRVGTITLTPAQFGAWSGLVTNLNENAQTFVVRARAACQFLADGGIPATINGTVNVTNCTTFGTSTNLSGVVMGHAWVAANSKLYDPAFKRNRLEAGMDMAAAMQCGTMTAPTCGEGIRSALVAGAPSGTFAGAPYLDIDAADRTALRNQLRTYAQRMEDHIKTNAPGAELVDVVGGIERDLLYSPTPGTELPYVSTQQYSWNEIPDTFRTRMRVRAGNYDFNFFADEIAGRRVRLMSWTEFFIDHQTLAATGCTSCVANTVILDVAHPYAANTGSFADIHSEFLMVDLAEANSSDRGTPPVTIVHSWGNASAATERYFSELQTVDPYAGATSAECGGIVGGILEGVGFTPDGWIDHTGCENPTQPTLAAKLLHQGARADGIVEGATRVNLTRHHNIGIIYARVWGPTSLNFLSVQSALSVNSRTNTATARTAAFEGTSAMWAMLEGSLYQQMADKYQAMGVAANFMDRADGIFLNVAPSNMAAVLAALNPWETYFWWDDRKGRLQDAANNGYSTIMTTVAPGAGGSIFYTSAASSYALYEGAKGGAALGSANPAELPLQTLNEEPPSWYQANKSSVGLAGGELTLTPPPDIVTGVGDFPHSLAFQRTYRSSSGTSERIVGTSVNHWHPQSTANPPVNSSSSREYSGADADYSVKMGGGWAHNLEVLARYSNDAPAALGADSGLDAGSVIAGIFALSDAARVASFSNRLATMFGSAWVGERLMSNHVTISAGANSEAFHRLLDGTFNAPPGSGSRLLQTGELVANFRDYSPITLRYIRGDGDEIAFNWAGLDWNELSAPRFKATTWTFPDGVIVTFGYQHYNTQFVVPAEPNRRLTNQRHILASVSNNLGRRLTINSSILIVPGGDPMAGWMIGGFKMTGITDENGRSVDIDLSGCPADRLFACSTLVVTSPANAPTKYEYAANTDSPDPAILLRPNYQLRRWFKPSDQDNPYNTVLFDELFRVRQTTDVLGRTTKYHPGGILGSELWKRGEVIDPANNATVSVLDENANVLSVTDANNHTTRHEYDDLNRETRTISPEGDEVVRTYDVRSNPLTVVRKAKVGSGLANINEERNTYVEGPNVRVCVNQKTCNRISSAQDARNQTTSYGYHSGTGLMLTRTSPSVELGTGTGIPRTTLCYSPFTTSNGTVNLLTGKIERVNNSTTRVTSFGYNTSNKYVLSSVITDPTTTLTPPGTGVLTCGTATKSGAWNLTTGYTFDAVGNVLTVNGPRNDVTDVADVTNYRFDVARRPTRSDAPLGAITRYTYDIDGQRRTVRKAKVSAPTDSNPANPSPSDLDPSQWSTETRDFTSNGKLKSVLDPEGNLTQYTHDVLDRVTLTTDPDNRRTGTVFDAVGQVRCTWKGWNSTTAPTDCNWNPADYVAQGNAGRFRYGAYTYSDNGKQIAVQDAGNNITDLVYDGFDRLAFTLFPHPTSGNRCTVTPPVTASTVPSCPDGSLQTYEKSTYDAAGNRLSLRTRKDDTVTWTYDNLSRVRTKAVSGTPALPLVTNGYNLLGEPMSSTSPASADGTIPAHSVTYDYDGAGRRLFEENLVNGTSRRVSYLHNPAGKRTRTTWPDGYFVHYSFDALNRMSFAYENSTSANELARYQYDELGRRKDLRYAGLATNQIGYTYEADGNLDVLTNVLNTVSLTMDYGHNASGQINSIVANDAFDLAKPAQASSTVYVPDKLNRYRSVGTNPDPTYDLNGNLLTWGPAATRSTYTYDPENQLRTGAVLGGSSASYDYDTAGRRLSKTVDSVSTFYLLDGDEEIAEYSSAGLLLRRYIMGPAVDERIAAAEGSAVTNPTKTYYHINHQGSVIAMTDSTGNAAGCGIGVNCQRLSYDSYGNLGAGSTGTGQPYRFTGRRFDVETGLYFYRARYYSPELGRFLQTDQIGYGPDLNLYGYVGNDPLNKNDPSGNAPPLAAWLGGQAAYNGARWAAGAAATWAAAKASAAISNWLTDMYRRQMSGPITPPTTTLPVMTPPSSNTSLPIATPQSSSTSLPAADPISSSTSTPVDHQVDMPPVMESRTHIPPGTTDIYVVPGKYTESGLPYVGRTSDTSRYDYSGDGRDRKHARVIGNVPIEDGPRAEQQAINDRGGVEKLDNQRDEIAECRWDDCNVEPPQW